MVTLGEMRLLATLNSEAEAQALRRRLVAMGISCTAEPLKPVWQVWLVREEDFARAQGELVRFQAETGDRQDGRGPAATVQGLGDAAAGAEDVPWKQKSMPVVLILIGICVLVAVLTHLGSRPAPWGYLLMVDDPSREHVVQMLNEAEQKHGTDAVIEALHGQRELWLPALDSVRHGEVWRLFTPMFLHFGAVHLFFNMWWMYSLGGALERRSGSWLLLGLVLLTDVGSVLAQYMWSGPRFGGMSGVVYGIFGYVWIRGRTDEDFGIGIPGQTVTIMLIWLVGCMTGLLGPVANAAHVAGLVIGMACGIVPAALRRMRRVRPVGGV